MSLLDAIFTDRDYTDDCESRGGARIRYVFVHHATNTSVWATVDLSKPGGRTVSMNAALGNGRVVETIPKHLRPYTSASYLDAYAYTMEISNSSIGGDWPIADVEFHNAARIIAAVATEESFPIDDDHVLMHWELSDRFGESYPTLCAGPYLNERKAALLALARKYQAGGTAPAEQAKPKEIKVKTYDRNDHQARNGGRKVKPGEGFYLNTKKGAPASAYSNLVGGTGPYQLIARVEATGTPGDILEVVPAWKTAKGWSAHYTERLVFDRDGRISASFPYTRPVKSLEEVRIGIASDKDNVGEAKVTIFDSTATLFTVA